MRTLKPLNIDNKEINRLENIINKIDEYGLKVVRSCEVIYYYYLYRDIKKIIKETGVSRKTIFNYLKKYKQDKFFMFNKKNVSILDTSEIKNKIENNFKKYPVKSYKEATDRIANITKINRSTTQIYYYLTNNGYKKNKNGYYTKNGVDNKITKKKNSFLYEHLEEIGEYIKNNPSGDPNIVINRIRNKYPLITEKDNEILEALKDYLPF